LSHWPKSGIDAIDDLVLGIGREKIEIQIDFFDGDWIQLNFFILIEHFLKVS